MPERRAFRAVVALEVEELFHLGRNNQDTDRRCGREWKSHAGDW
jgi:hypothetical protein